MAALQVNAEFGISTFSTTAMATEWRPTWMPRGPDGDALMIVILGVILLVAFCFVIGAVAMFIYCACRFKRMSDVAGGGDDRSGSRTAAQQRRRSSAAGGSKHTRVSTVDGDGGGIEMARGSGGSGGVSSAGGTPPQAEEERTPLAASMELRPAEEEAAAAAAAEARFAAARRASGGAKPKTQRAGALRLHALPDLESAVFERNWDALVVRKTWRRKLRSGGLDGDALIARLAKSCVFCIASGALDGVAKYYLYSVDEPSGELYFAELLVNSTHLNASIKSTCTKSSAVGSFSELLTRVVGSSL